MMRSAGSACYMVKGSSNNERRSDRTMTEGGFVSDEAKMRMTVATR